MWYKYFKITFANSNYRLNDNIGLIWKQSVTGLLENFPSQQAGQALGITFLLPFYDVSLA